MAAGTYGAACGMYYAPSVDIGQEVGQKIGLDQWRKWLPGEEDLQPRRREGSGRGRGNDQRFVVGSALDAAGR